TPRGGQALVMRGSKFVVTTLEMRPSWMSSASNKCAQFIVAPETTSRIRPCLSGTVNCFISWAYVGAAFRPLGADLLFSLLMHVVYAPSNLFLIVSTIAAARGIPA